MVAGRREPQRAVAGERTRVYGKERGVGGGTMRARRTSGNDGATVSI